MTAFRELHLTSPMTRGADVARAQHLLRGDGSRFGSFDPGVADGVYGPQTASAVRRAQYWLGRLHPDGVYREQLAGQLAGKPLTLSQRTVRAARLRRRSALTNTVGARAFRAAASEVGVEEHPAGSNDGPRVHEYESATGAYRQPWCASFVAWCLDRAGFKRDASVNWAYCPSILAAARDGRAGLHVVATPRHGDLALYDWDRDGTADHVEFVDGAGPSSGEWRTLGGNTSRQGDPTGSQSNGGIVARRIRYSSDIIAFVRVSNP